MEERKSRDERKAATRESLVRAGCDLVRQRGFAVSLEEIARSAGLTKGAVYSNFSGRTELLTAVAERVIVDFAVTFPEGAGSLAEGLEDTAHQLVRILDRRPQSLVLTLDLVVAMMREPELGEAIAGLSRPGEREPPLVPGGWEVGMDPEWFSVLFNSLGVGLALHRLLFGKDAVPEELFVRAFRLLAPGSGPG